MLSELRVRDLGVIADLTLVLGPGMTALTGETGAGKTLVVEAIELLVGGRADRVLVRPGAEEAWVEARFVANDEELVIARAVPATGSRARAYVDGRMSPVGGLSELGADLVDLHGQHAHQSLLAPSVQRAALDAYASIDRTDLLRARDQIKQVDAALASFGGDARARAREVDLLRFQLREIDDAKLTDADEDDALEREEDGLANAVHAREAATAAHDALAGDGGAADIISNAIALAQHLPDVAPRLRSLQAEAAALASDLRAMSETLDDDPERLAEIRQRRHLFHELRRKYGDAIGDVLAFRDEARAQLDELESHDARVQQLEVDRTVAADAAAKAAAAIAKARKKAAPKLAAAIQERLRDLALPAATVKVAVDGEGPADDVTFLLSANAGEPPLPLAKVASGGELARTMLAARLVLTAGPPTLVFDEVDAGIGGAAAVAVGRALAALGEHHQVLVVTHLPQVAAFADAQIAVTKAEHRGRAVATATVLDGDARVRELSRMLSGQPDSATARVHAEELLASAALERGR